MTRFAARSILLLGALGATLPAVARAQPKAADLVKLELVADTTRLEPGKPVTLAVKFTIAPGWHIYWQNPGEAGLATEVELKGPAGYEIGAVRFPGPVKFQTPGETAASYGYSGSAVLSSSVAPTARAGKAAAPARFVAEATYLACRDMCIRGQASASLELPAASRAEPARPAHAELFKKHRAELPRSMKELGARARWTRDERGVQLALALRRGDAVEYFPPTGEDLQLVAQEPGGTAGKREIVLRYKPAFKPARARGVLAVTEGQERRFYALDLEEKPK